MVGVLETLWRVTQADAPAGDIGRLDNIEIADAMEWEGDPDELINALVETHWIDEDDEFRLVIHNWSKHVPNHLKGAFIKYGKKFADQLIAERNGHDIVARDDAKQTAKQDAKEDAMAPCLGTMPKQHATQPNQTKPSLTQPNHPQTPENSVAGGWDSWTIDSEARCRLELTACGYKRYNELISECREAGLFPRHIIESCIEYKANETKFSSPGAIAERLRTGVWPANGVLPASEAKRVVTAKESAAKQKVVESLRVRLVKAGDNDARNWNEKQIFARAKELGFA